LEGSYSFFSKNITTGAGGMLVTDDEGIAEKLHNLRSQDMIAMN
jgi:dTDP-4-amino-4,6-dideoxygalactose transaminase